jgi:Resolvase, N terminal domain
VKVFEDKGISGVKGRDKRPSFDALLKAAVRRKVDMIAVWSSDRLGRSLSHLVEVLQTIRDTGTGLYIHTQAVDTTTPAGRAMFGMLGIFAEFEREMLVARVNAGLARAKDALTRDGSLSARQVRCARASAGPRSARRSSAGCGRSWPRASASSPPPSGSASATAPCIVSVGKWRRGDGPHLVASWRGP